MSVVSGIMQSNATESAADTAAQSATDAAAQQYKMFQEQQAAMEPWRASGANALNRLNAMMGLPQYQVPVANALGPGSGAPPVAPVMPNFNDMYIVGEGDTGRYLNPNFDMGGDIEKYNQDLAKYYQDLAKYNATPQPSNAPAATQPGPQDWRFLMDPGYEFRKQEGINALAAAGAASGNYGSGNMGVALQDFGQNLASQEFQNVYNRLAGISGTGQVQSQAMGNLGVNTGNVMANYLNQAGQNIAQGQVAGANAMAGGVRDLEKGIASYYMYGKGGGVNTGPNSAFYDQSYNDMWGY